MTRCPPEVLPAVCSDLCCCVSVVIYVFLCLQINSSAIHHPSRFTIRTWDIARGHGGSSTVVFLEGRVKDQGCKTLAHNYLTAIEPPIGLTFAWTGHDCSTDVESSSVRLQCWRRRRSEVEVRCGLAAESACIVMHA